MRPATRAEDPRVVVLAEDEDDLCEAILQILEDAGYLVVPVATVARLRAVLESLAPSALVLDFHLKDGTTAELIGELAGRAAAPNVLLLSASTAAAATARRTGVVLLTKPFDIDALVAAVDRASGRSPVVARDAPQPVRIANPIDANTNAATNAKSTT